MPTNKCLNKHLTNLIFDCKSFINCTRGPYSSRKVASTVTIFGRSEAADTSTAMTGIGTASGVGTIRVGGLLPGAFAAA